MKVLGINCSPRKNGNTELLIREVFKVLEDKGINNRVFSAWREESKGCIACMKCRKKADGKCHQDNEIINKCIKKMIKADGIIIGSPTYYADLSTEAKALIDVSGYALGGSGNPLKRKPGAAVIAVRRAGGNTCI